MKKPRFVYMHIVLYELLCAVFSISTFTPISIIADTTIVTDATATTVAVSAA